MGGVTELFSELVVCIVWAASRSRVRLFGGSWIELIGVNEVATLLLFSEMVANCSIWLASPFSDGRGGNERRTLVLLVTGLLCRRTSTTNGFLETGGGGGSEGCRMLLWERGRTGTTERSVWTGWLLLLVCNSDRRFPGALTVRSSPITDLNRSADGDGWLVEVDKNDGEGNVNDGDGVDNEDEGEVIDGLNDDGCGNGEGGTDAESVSGCLLRRGKREIFNSSWRLTGRVVFWETIDSVGGRGGSGRLTLTFGFDSSIWIDVSVTQAEEFFF